MRDEVWLVYYDNPKFFEPELHIVCGTEERANQYIKDNLEQVFFHEYLRVEKHQVY
jgi:hypothetical protein